MNPKRIRIVFIGGLIGGHKALEALLEAGEDVVAAFTWSSSHSDASCFQSFEDIEPRFEVPVHKVEDINDPVTVEAIGKLNPDLIVVICWSQIIGKRILDIAPHGAIGMHPTLLPRNRGRAPIPWAIIKGLDLTGVTIFKYEPKVDSGSILEQEAIPVEYRDTALDLGLKVDEASIRLLLRAVRRIAEQAAEPIRQDHSKANYWPKRRPEDGVIDWEKSSEDLYNWIRGLSRPYPGAFTRLDGRTLYVWEAAQHDEPVRGRPGQVLVLLPEGLLVATGRGGIVLRTLQLEGGSEMPAAEFAEKTGLQPGSVLGGS